MKINVFVETNNGGFRTIGLESEFNPTLEDDIIKSVDHKKETPKQKAQRFFSFLATKELSMAGLSVLPNERQQEIKAEFLED